MACHYWFLSVQNVSQVGCVLDYMDYVQYNAYTGVCMPSVDNK